MDKDKIKNVKSKVSAHHEEEKELPPQLDNARVPGRPRTRGTNTSSEGEKFEELRLRDSPSPTNFTPWNNITLVFNTNNSHSTIDASKLFCQLRKQIDPHKHFLGTVTSEDLVFKREEFNLLPLDLMLAQHAITTCSAMQVRIRQIKIWADKTAHLTVSIFELLEENKGSPKVALAKRISEPIDGIKTFGCKLPQHMRDTLYYSLDYANTTSPILRYAVDQGSNTTVQFNIEWKAMSYTRSEFVKSVYSKQFKKELAMRQNLSPPRRFEKGVQKEESKHSLSEIPSKVIREWSGDPILLNYKKDKTVVDSTNLQIEEKGPHSTSPQHEPLTPEKRLITTPVPSSSREGDDKGSLSPIELCHAQIKFMDKTIATLDLLTAKIDRSSEERVQRVQKMKEQQKGNTDEEKQA